MTFDSDLVKLWIICSLASKVQRPKLWDFLHMSTTIAYPTNWAWISISSPIWIENQLGESLSLTQSHAPTPCVSLILRMCFCKPRPIMFFWQKKTNNDLNGQLTMVWINLVLYCPFRNYLTFLMVFTAYEGRFNCGLELVNSLHVYYCREFLCTAACHECQLNFVLISCTVNCIFVWLTSYLLNSVILQIKGRGRLEVFAYPLCTFSCYIERFLCQQIKPWSSS